MTHQKTSTSDLGNDLLLTSTVQVLRAYMECSNEIRRGILDMAAILASDETDEQEKAAAADTLIEALYPQYVGDELGIDSEKYELAHLAVDSQVEHDLDAEEARFSEKLAEAMAAKKVTQLQLAEAIGVGQSAISMMLNRNCRPQKSTVVKIAKALGMPARELWPTNHPLNATPAVRSKSVHRGTKSASQRASRNP